MGGNPASHYSKARDPTATASTESISAVCVAHEHTDKRLLCVVEGSVGRLPLYSCLALSPCRLVICAATSFFSFPTRPPSIARTRQYLVNWGTLCRVGGTCSGATAPSKQRSSSWLAHQKLGSTEFVLSVFRVATLTNTTTRHLRLSQENCLTMLLSKCSGFIVACI